MILHKKLRALACGVALAVTMTPASAAVINLETGSDLAANGGTMSCASDGAQGTGCSIVQSANGLGVATMPGMGGSRVIDGVGGRESVTIAFADQMAWSSISLGLIDKKDEVRVIADGVSLVFTKIGTSIDLGGIVSSYLTIEAVNATDNYTLSRVDVAPIPLPAAGFLLLAGLGGLALTRKRAA